MQRVILLAAEQPVVLATAAQRRRAPGAVKWPPCASALRLQNSLIIHQFLVALTAERKMM